MISITPLVTLSVIEESSGVIPLVTLSVIEEASGVIPLKSTISKEPVG